MRPAFDQVATAGQIVDSATVKYHGLSGLYPMDDPTKTMLSLSTLCPTVLLEVMAEVILGPFQTTGRVMMVDPCPSAGPCQTVSDPVVTVNLVFLMLLFCYLRRSFGYLLHLQSVDGFVLMTTVF
jgi:hypothetical protein